MNRRRKRSEITTASESVSSDLPRAGTGAYGDLLTHELAAQESRKASFEQRGLAVVTTAGTLVTLLFGLTTLISKVGKHPYQLTSEERIWLAFGLVLFLLAAAAALATNLPLPYQAVPAEEVRARLKETPIRNEEAARRDIALTQIRLLADAKRKNTWKGWMLFAGMAFEVLAVYQF